jgi:hypothetical protein
MARIFNQSIYNLNLSAAAFEIERRFFFTAISRIWSMSQEGLFLSDILNEITGEKLVQASGQLKCLLLWNGRFTIRLEFGRDKGGFLRI